MNWTWDDDEVLRRVADQRHRLALMRTLADLARVSISARLDVRHHRNHLFPQGDVIAEVRVDEDGNPIAVVVALP